MPRDAQQSQATVISTTKPSAARVYDCFLGGKDNYEIDRQVFRQVDSVAPEMKQIARAGRAWLLRVIRFLAGTAHVGQFIDLGAGLPTGENTHQAAQRMNRDARVIYIDNDPVVAAHGRALLEENDRTLLVAADLTKPDAVFNDPAIMRFLDPELPLALIHGSTLHHVRDEEGPWDIMRRYIELMPSGSYLALNHFHDPEDGGAASKLAHVIENVLTEVGLPAHFRTRAEIERMFDGLELVEPGLTQLNEWWPDGPLLSPGTADQVALGGVARKP